MTILLVVLALLAVLSGFGLIFYSTIYRPNQLHMQATATAQTQQTIVAQTTATAYTQATGTAVAISHATATAQAQATANVIATATALQNIYTSATKGSPVEHEDSPETARAKLREAADAHFQGELITRVLIKKGSTLPVPLKILVSRTLPIRCR